MPWNGYERRRNGGLTDDELEAIAERVAKLLESRLPAAIALGVWAACQQQFTLAVGKWTLRVGMLLAGAASLACYLFVQYLQAKGVI